MYTVFMVVMMFVSAGAVAVVLVVMVVFMSAGAGIAVFVVVMFMFAGVSVAVFMVVMMFMPSMFFLWVVSVSVFFHINLHSAAFGWRHK